MELNNNTKEELLSKWSSLIEDTFSEIWGRNRISRLDLDQNKFDYSLFSDDAWHKTYFDVIEKHCDLNEVNVFCEIGGGAGGFIDYLARFTNIKKFIDIDLYPTLCIAILNLTDKLDGYKLILCESEKDIALFNSLEKAILFVPTKIYNRHKKELKEIPINFFHNTISFSEMLEEHRIDYFRFIQSFDDCYFFNANKKKKTKPKVNPKKFPYDGKWRKIYLGYSKPLYIKLLRR